MGLVFLRPSLASYRPRTKIFPRRNRHQSARDFACCTGFAARVPLRAPFVADLLDRAHRGSVAASRRSHGRCIQRFIRAFARCRHQQKPDHQDGQHRCLDEPRAVRDRPVIRAPLRFQFPPFVVSKHLLLPLLLPDGVRRSGEPIVSRAQPPGDAIRHTAPERNSHLCAGPPRGCGKSHCPRR